MILNRSSTLQGAIDAQIEDFNQFKIKYAADKEFVSSAERYSAIYSIEGLEGFFWIPCPDSEVSHEIVEIPDNANMIIVYPPELIQSTQESL